MTKYKYIRMQEVPQDPKKKTQTWNVMSNRSNHVLGLIKWYGPWRQYCFFPATNCIFNRGCMNDINDFLQNEMAKR